MNAAPPSRLSALGLPRLVAHRGALREAPENTLAAFARAAERGARWVEFDVQLSADGVPFLLHDETMDRTTDGQGPAACRPWAELAALDAGARCSPAFAGERIPTLGQALAFCAAHALGVNVEIKPGADAAGRVAREAETGAAVAAAVARLWPAGLPVPLLSSFSGTALVAARRAAPRLPRGLCVEDWPGDWRAQLFAHGAVSIHPRQDTLDAARVAAVRATGCGCVPWTVNDPARAAELFAWGCEAVFTDALADLAAAACAAG